VVVVVVVVVEGEGDGRRAADGEGDETSISAQRGHHVGARLNDVQRSWQTLRNLVLLRGVKVACTDAS
jgi:hypothetical protein